MIAEVVPVMFCPARLRTLVRGSNTPTIGFAAVPVIPIFNPAATEATPPPPPPTAHSNPVA